MQRWACHGNSSHAAALHAGCLSVCLLGQRRRLAAAAAVYRSGWCAVDRLPCVCIRPSHASQRPVSCEYNHLVSTLARRQLRRMREISADDAQIVILSSNVSLVRSASLAARQSVFGAAPLLNYSLCGRRLPVETRTSRPREVVTLETASNWHRWC